LDGARPHSGSRCPRRHRDRGARGDDERAWRDSPPPGPDAARFGRRPVSRPTGACDVSVGCGHRIGPIPSNPAHRASQTGSSSLISRRARSLCTSHENRLAGRGSRNARMTGESCARNAGLRLAPEDRRCRLFGPPGPRLWAPAPGFQQLPPHGRMRPVVRDGGRDWGRRPDFGRFVHVGRANRAA
jgi:hypothetical protein